jgi:hypothetical protein
VAQLSIADVRREIMRAAGRTSSTGVPSTAIAGSLFHEMAAWLMGPEGWQAALEPNEVSEPGRLSAHAYEHLLGLRLTEMQASLREYGAETLALWQATQSMCSWVCRLLQSATQRGLIRYDSRERVWVGAASLCRPEGQLRWELREPQWTAPVVVSGVADALWRDPESGRWCVVEYKLGQGNPEADLAQACLYHAMLSSRGPTAGDGALAIFSFRPQLEERFYPGAQLETAQAALRSLIGRLAGVLPEAPPVAFPEAEHAELGKKLLRALQHYGVSLDWSGEVVAGPTFLRYHVMPGRNLRKKAITDKAEELQMQLHLEQAPFIHLANGRLVIDVQRPDRQTVPFSSVASQLPHRQSAGNSIVPLGVDLDGKLQVADLASPNNPHLLVAGTSGSGKSEWLRMAIAGMLLSNTPETLRLVLIDPKRVAFTELKSSPYLYGNKGLIYPPEDPAFDTLQTLIEEMEERYRRFSQAAVSDMTEYLARTGDVIPRIVCVCDEYADLIAERAAAKEVENAIHRLGAKARAAGIHLIVATQYPDRKTVGGALKMNLGGRICLRTTNHVQSNMIVNQSGAERLLGKGDLLFLSIGEPIRLQAPYLSPEERTRIFLQVQKPQVSGFGAQTRIDTSFEP